MATKSRAIAPRARAPTAATGIASGTRDQLGSTPKTTATRTSVTSMVMIADAIGNRKSERMLATGPNGETAMRSKVPATSS